MKLDRIRRKGMALDYSDYFSYIKSVAKFMPDSLRDYAADTGSYTLDGVNTLHDSRILSAVFENKYDENFSNAVSSAELSFIDQMFEKVMLLRYDGVSSYLVKGVDLALHKHADVLAHEFSVVSEGLYRHRIVFDHDGGVEINFRNFSCKWGEASSR